MLKLTVCVVLSVVIAGSFAAPEPRRNSHASLRDFQDYLRSHEDDYEDDNDDDNELDDLDFEEKSETERKIHDSYARDKYEDENVAPSTKAPATGTPRRTPGATPRGPRSGTPKRPRSGLPKGHRSGPPRGPHSGPWKGPPRGTPEFKPSGTPPMRTSAMNKRSPRPTGKMPPHTGASNTVEEDAPATGTGRPHFTTGTGKHYYRNETGPYPTGEHHPRTNGMQGTKAPRSGTPPVSSKPHMAEKPCSSHLDSCFSILKKCIADFPDDKSHCLTINVSCQNACHRAEKRCSMKEYYDETHNYEKCYVKLITCIY